MMTSREAWESIGQAHALVRDAGKIPHKTGLSHHRPAGERKLRLAVCACVRIAASPCREAELLAASMAAEFFADGLVGERTLDEVREVLENIDLRREDVGAGLKAFLRACFVSKAFLRSCAENAVRETGRAGDEQILWACRDIFGHQWPAFPGVPKFARKDVDAIAHEAYFSTSDGGPLDRLSLLALADRLEEAGCEYPCPINYGKGFHKSPPGLDWQCAECGGTEKIAHPVLAHLRLDKPHYRGCWALDVVMGKS